MENSIEHAAVLAKDSYIRISDLPSALLDPHSNDTSESQVTIIENEKKLLTDVLEECGWNKKQAAERLGISRSTLYSKLRKYQIAKPGI